VVGLVTATGVGSIDYQRDGEILRCPWHGWEFDLRNGRSVVDPTNTRVRSYDVVVGELTVETYPVEVDGDTLSILM
jgi:3-phenylpropionate/trans-cinnamate dioxygenase ferredoxin subunit